jgi:uncharacterized membrane protein YfcA
MISFSDPISERFKFSSSSKLINIHSASCTKVSLLFGFIVPENKYSFNCLGTSFSSKLFYVMPVKLTIAILLSVFALFDILPKLTKLQFDKKYLPLGGLLSGFFGGLSGNQGALRTAFLIRANLTKEAFIATGVVIAVLIDISRLTVYTKQILSIGDNFNYPLIISATLSAFGGAFIGNRLLKKVTINAIQYIVATMLFIFALLLGLGII